MEFAENAEAAYIDRQLCAHAESQFHTDLYAECMGNVSHVLHPFYDGVQENCSSRVRLAVEDEPGKVGQVIGQCSIRDNYGLYEKVCKQVEDLVSVIDIWNGIKADSVKSLGLSPKEERWFLGYLLPRVYWQQAIKRTKHAPTKERLKVELEKVKKRSTLLKVEITPLIKRELEERAQYICSKFQRASSQVEGRNGQLSRINHNRRGIGSSRLKVLTVIHNFDTRAEDGTTPAERLTRNQVKFEPLFDYIIKNYKEIPIPRKNRRAS